MKAFLLLLAAAFLAGCAHPAPRAIVIPTALAVRAPITTARASNARAEKLAAEAVRKGIVAGSTEARALVLATTTTDSELADALTKVDTLTAELLTVQKRVDTQTGDLATLTTRYNAAVKTIWWYRFRFWGPLTLAVVALGLILAAKFTAWGARTVGPYLVDAEHVAVKAAILA